MSRSTRPFHMKETLYDRIYVVYGGKDRVSGFVSEISQYFFSDFLIILVGFISLEIH